MHELNQHKIAALLPQRRAQSNKGSYGSVAAAAGSLAYRGAAALCVEGALRTGAGLVYLASVEPVIQLVLTRAPETYTVGSILRLTEGSLATVACLEEGAPACPRMAECRTYPLWYKLDGMISEYLDSVTLADLMQYPDAGNEYVI